MRLFLTKKLVGFWGKAFEASIDILRLSVLAGALASRKSSEYKFSTYINLI